MSQNSIAVGPPSPAAAQPRAIAAAMFPAPAKPILIAQAYRRRLGRPVAQDWLKKPFSTRRARSSAETSTLRGVSMKVFSAIFCMPPSSA